jgi:prepilin-type N-terminal cleavage/methylation domain-containing protein
MPCRSAVRRHAFTLLEVLLAISLSLVLLTALYSALKLHLTFAQRGPEQVRNSQRARAIVERIARDVRAVIPPAAKAQSTGTSTSGTGSTGASSGSTTNSTDGSTASTTGTTNTSTDGTTSSTSTEGTTTGTDAYVAAYGVLGGTDWLQLYIANYLPNLDDAELAASTGSVAQISNVVRVTYALTVLTTSADSKGRTQRLALYRSEVASVGAERLDSASDDSDIRATTTYLADDLAYVQFQYWDDLTATWLDSWGVDTPIAPPRAIKVFISLQKPEEYLESSLGMSGGLSTWEPNFQLVIPIATWDPDAESSSTEGL